MRGRIGAISLHYGRRLPIFRGRLRAPPGRTGYLGPAAGSLAAGAGARPPRFGHARDPAPRSAGPAPKIGTPPDAVTTPNALSWAHGQTLSSHRIRSPAQVRDARPVAGHALAADVVP